MSISPDVDRIASIERVGLVHMCGGQGMDDELKCFLQKSFVKETEDTLILTSALKKIAIDTANPLGAPAKPTVSILLTSLPQSILTYKESPDNA
jgi:hypothetical protein